MRGRNSPKIFGSGEGRPSLGSRACRCDGSADFGRFNQLH
jgi:hypothetical protein